VGRKKGEGGIAMTIKKEDVWEKKA